MAGIGDTALLAAMSNAKDQTTKAQEVATSGQTAVASFTDKITAQFPQVVAGIQDSIQQSYTQQVKKEAVAQQINDVAGTSFIDQQFLTAASQSAANTASNVMEAQAAAKDTWLTHPINRIVRELTNNTEEAYTQKAEESTKQMNTLQTSHVAFNALVDDEIKKKQSLLPTTDADYRASQLQQMKDSVTAAHWATTIQAAPTIMAGYEASAKLAGESGNQAVMNANLDLAMLRNEREKAAQGQDMELRALSIQRENLTIDKLKQDATVIKTVTGALAADGGMDKATAEAKFLALPLEDQNNLVRWGIGGEKGVAINSTRVKFLTQGVGGNPNNPNVSQGEIFRADSVTTRARKLAASTTSPDGSFNQTSLASAKLATDTGLTIKQLATMKPVQLQALISKTAADEETADLATGKDSFVQTIQPGTMISAKPELVPAGTGVIFAPAKSWDDSVTLGMQQVVTGKWTPKQAVDNWRSLATSIAAASDKASNKVAMGLPLTSHVYATFNVPSLIMGEPVPTQVDLMDTNATNMALMSIQRERPGASGRRGAPYTDPSLFNVFKK